MPLSHDDLLRRLLSERDRLMGYLYSIMRDHHLAEDLLQNVSILVLKKGQDLQGIWGHLTHPPGDLMTTYLILLVWALAFLAAGFNRPGTLIYSQNARHLPAPF